ncbi:MAG: Porin type major outer membrane protein [candidate division Zixibacteria bacterium RBG-1]|nr:MAG: Porin type major outer membrane protein [candidate division Zixibacteria bacterium RBG-1]OGC85995.1 MAG: hypothetical protein A2V73_04130 [candidate division Zixibacteria bacterium RBG_19FT_COMBO_42_43]
MTLSKIFLIAVALFSLAIPVWAVELVKGENLVELHFLLQLRRVDFGQSHTSINNEGQVYSGFIAKRGEIRLEGSLNEENLRWGIMLDPIGLSNKITQDAYISLEYIPFFNIKMGQFKYPQNLDGRTSNAKLIMIERSILGRTFGTKRDLGIEFSYNHKYFEYALGLVNGSGQNNPENNDKKDWVARVLAKPVPYISLGGSIYRGRQPSGITQRTAAEVKFNYKNFILQSEYQVGKDSSLERWGVYLQASYQVGNIVQPCLRGEIWEPGKNNLKDKKSIIAGGINFFLKGESTKISFNYFLVTEETNETDNNEFIMQWQLSF